MCKKARKIKNSDLNNSNNTSSRQLINCRGLGFWGYDFQGTTSIDLVKLFLDGGYGNIVMVKTRTVDNGSFSPIVNLVNQYPKAKVVIISQDEDIYKEINFIDSCVKSFGYNRIISIIARWDEVDLMGNTYNPPEIDRQINNLKAELANRGCGGIPVGINLSLGYGIGTGQGAEQIFNYDKPNPNSPGTWTIAGINKGVPQELDIIYLEGYPITAGWFINGMWPKVIKPTAELLPQKTKIGVIGQIWQEPSQKKAGPPNYDLVKIPYDTWANSTFADRILVYLLYRGSNDERGVSDCWKAPGQLNSDGSVELVLPDAMRAVKEICDLNEWKAR